ncbi:hypothetical protein COCNU_11G002640 [Cocos nucifera]|uniref:SAM domain-containing protein n=1 Tax=Cocos nucifera TaxID=13894 RepID=A0A8K0IMY5_COCNU|nr:hypothetical protein COCNU_11G002640 [Cocos nucifera]
MYADREAAGRKRSIMERLNGGLADDVGRTRSATGKRQRQTDEKWKHDLYNDDEGPQVSNLRMKLQKKDMQQVYQGGKESRVRDLREKLSGTLNPQPTSTDLPKPKPVSEIVKPVQKATRAEATVPDTKSVPAPASSKKQSKQKIGECLKKKVGHIVDFFDELGVQLCSSSTSGLNLLSIISPECSPVSVGFQLSMLFAKEIILAVQQDPARNVLLNESLDAESELSVDSLLQSLGLEKYSITFKAEEVDMTALVHMTDADLKALGIPMHAITVIQARLLELS